jgi:hypothetical protein
MSEAVRNSPIPAGWYPDPHGLPQQRWWSGNQWTGTVAPIAPLAAPTPLSSLPGPVVRPRGQHALDATSSETTTFPSRRALRQAGGDLTTGEMNLPNGADALGAGPANGVTADLGPNLTAGSMAAAENPADPILSGPTLAAFGAPSAGPAVYAAPVAAHAVGVPAVVPSVSVVPAVAAVPAAPVAPPVSAAPASAPAAAPALAPTAASPATPDPAAAYPLAGLASPALANAAYPAAAPQQSPPPFTQALFGAPVSVPRADAPTAATPAPFALTPRSAAPANAPASVTSAAEAPGIPGWHPAPVSASTTPNFAIAPAAVPFTPSRAAVTSAATPAENVHDMPYQPFGMIPKITSGVVGPPDRINTVAVWLIVIMPLLMVATGVVVVLQLGDFYTRFMQGGLVFIFALATIGLAIRDRRDLADSGHVTTASPAWVLLTPLGYLIARAVEVRRQAGRSGGALVVWLLIVAAIVAAAFLLPEWFTRLISAAAVI